MPFKVIQDHQFCYQSIARMRLSVSQYTNLYLILNRFPSNCRLLVKCSLLTGRISLYKVVRGEPLSYGANVHCVSKTWCRIFAITLSAVNRFRKFFHCWK